MTNLVLVAITNGLGLVLLEGWYSLGTVHLTDEAFHPSRSRGCFIGCLCPTDCLSSLISPNTSLSRKEYVQTTILLINGSTMCVPHVNIFSVI